MATGSGPVQAYDAVRMERELDAYQDWLDEHCEALYQLAGQARAQGKDLRDVVEIPRAADLASRTEKLLEEYLDDMEIAEEIRELLAEFDRETSSIKMAARVAKRMHERTGDIQRSIDTGLRVGLAVLTEAVLVAPLEGIGRVQVLNNPDGTRFVSVDFCGPIRAAGGTAQALGVLIADMIRRELGLDKYKPTDPEVERVKEEFGLYRGGLQYRPSPEEIDMIVRACPIMVNGEETEQIECAGYPEVRNIVGKRVRGGVLLVIGEGLCLKAPKVQKHTERLEIAGWDFISHFAKKKGGGEKKAAPGGVKKGKRRAIAKIDRFMQDIIAGRPVFSEPNAPGGFRLRYGRPRAVGLAAAGIHPASMEAMGAFLSVGTQMKIERPGKACATTPCEELEGPTVLMRSGRYGRIQSAEEWKRIESDVISIWDNGELMLGFGEFAENNKNLVPAAYQPEWFASDLLTALADEATLASFLEITGTAREDWPAGIPATGTEDGATPDAGARLGAELNQRDWHTALRRTTFDWPVITALSRTFLTAVPPPWNLWWHDLPLQLVAPFIAAIRDATFEVAGSLDATRMEPAPAGQWMRIPGAVKHWVAIDRRPEDLPTKSGRSAKRIKRLVPGEIVVEEITQEVIPGAEIELPTPLFGEWPRHTHIEEHGLVKSVLLTLGVPHQHDGDDILVTQCWQPLLEGLGLAPPLEGQSGLRTLADADAHLGDRLDRLAEALTLTRDEKARASALEEKRAKVRIEAETAARQRGLNIADTDAAGSKAAEAIPDPGPADAERLEWAEALLDEHEVERSLWLVRKLSDLRWVAAAPCRIGCRMGRPEKAAPREMKGKPHAIFPIGNQGGAQRLITAAAESGSVRVQLGTRECEKCGRRTPFTICHHRDIPEEPVECGGNTLPTKVSSDQANARRQGTFQSVNLTQLLEQKRIKLGIDRIPRKFKGVKGMTSKACTPEPIEKGILRAKHQVVAFKAGTVRYDMIDVPVTHFRPAEIGTSWEKLVELGYTHDILGAPLTSDAQLLELFPQDFVMSRKAEDYLIRTCAFVDELLERFYGMDPFYRVEKAEDLVGHLCIALAPHTSGGVLTRIIGWTGASAGYGHTLFHAAKRRNCDGDEDAIMLLLDGLLNFSKVLLPVNRGGRMDAPLVLTTRLKPTELDKEALNVDTAWFYPRAFFEASQDQPHPKDVADQMDFVEQRIETVGAMRGYGFTHDADSLDAGPVNSSYKTLESMIDKMNAQLALGQLLRAVDVRKVASSVVESHFLPDLRGNLVAFTRQKSRCLSCGHSYRRMPLAGKCIQNIKTRGGLSGSRDGDTNLCGGNIALTVSEGAVRKYIHVMEHVIEHYGVDMYTKQRVDWLADSVESLFNNDRVTVFTLDDFL